MNPVVNLRSRFSVSRVSFHNPGSQLRKSLGSLTLRAQNKKSEESLASLRRDFSEAEIRDAANSRREAAYRKSNLKASQVSLEARSSLSRLVQDGALSCDESVLEPLTLAEIDIQRKRLDGDWIVRNDNRALTLTLVVGDSMANALAEAVTNKQNEIDGDVDGDVDVEVSVLDDERVKFTVGATEQLTRKHFADARNVDAVVNSWKEQNDVKVTTDGRKRRRVPLV